MLTGPLACRTSGIEQVASLEREVLADVGDDFIYFVEHIARAAFLYGLVIENRGGSAIPGYHGTSGCRPIRR